MSVCFKYRAAGLALLTSVSFWATTTLALGSDRPVSVGSSGSSGTGTDVVTRVRAGSPFIGKDTATTAEIRASGARPSADDAKAAAGGLGTVAEPRYADGLFPSVVLGWDSRMRAYTTLYPNRAIVYIERNGNHHCTGFMISRNTVATAGHCVHTGGSSGNWYNRRTLRVFPGRDGASSPFGSCTVARLHSVVGWTQNANRNFDYGAMRLNCTIGNTTGWFGMYSAAATGFFLNEPLIVSGYPGDKARQQWLSADKVRQSLSHQVRYRADTIGGHSGSPLWSDRSNALHAQGAWAYGIHTFGNRSSNINGGTRLRSAVVSNYINWINQL